MKYPECLTSLITCERVGFYDMLAIEVISSGTSQHLPAFTFSKLTIERNTRTTCEICSKLTIKSSELRQWRRSDAFIVNFGHMATMKFFFSYIAS